MPLSKARDRERKRQSRLEKALSTPRDIKPVQPKPPPGATNQTPYGYPGMVGVDADGNPVYEE